MKRFILTVIFLSFMMSLTSCYRKNSIDETGRRDIHYIVTNSVPYVLGGDWMLDYIYYKETDAYGRELFVYNLELRMSTEDIDVWVICQKTVGDQTYYYQDFCYYTCLEGNDISVDALEELKERNDWNKPLDEAKMVSSYCGVSSSRLDDFEFYLQTSKGDRIKEEIRKKFELPQNSYVLLDGIGRDAQGDVIIFVLILNRADTTVEDKVLGRYLVRYSGELTSAMINYTSVGDSFNLQEEIHGFRTGDGSLS